MKKIVYAIIYFLPLFLISLNAQISVKLQQPPPYQFRVEQFWKAILTNSGRTAVSIYLKGTATESVKGKVIEAASYVITIQPGIKIVSGRELGPFTVSQSNNQYKDIMLNTGSVPSGNYNICITAYEVTGGKQLSSDCISVVIENFNRLELISPFDQEVMGAVTDSLAENINRSPTIIFSWLPPIPLPPNARINYRLKLVEVLGNQSVYAAMESNPVYFESPIISATVLRYPIAAKQLTPGKEYAWAVEVFVDNYKTQESEIRSFEIAGGRESENKYSPDKKFHTGVLDRTELNQRCTLPSGLSILSNKNIAEPHSIFSSALQQSNLFGEQTNLKFYGDAKLTQVSSRKPPQFSQLPANYWTLEMNPRISFYEIPFMLNIYLSSLNKTSMQKLNSVSFALDVNEMRSKIMWRISEKIQEVWTSMELSPEKLKEIEALTDPLEINNHISEKIAEIRSSVDSSLVKTEEVDLISEKIREIQTSSATPLEKLKKLEVLSDSKYLEKMKEIELLNDPSKLDENAGRLGLISPAEKFFLDIKSFGVGKTYPEYSDLTVSGIPVNGINIEYNPGIFYLAAAAWNNLDGIKDVSFKRSFVAGRLGIGKKELAHLFFTLLKMKDDENTIPVPPNTFLTPQENQVIGTEGKITLFDNLLMLKSEAAVSMFTRDIRDAEIQNSLLPGFVKNIFNPKISTSYDYALNGTAVFDQPKNETYFSLEINRIGPGYISLAAPNIRSDQLMVEARFNRKFSGKRIGMKTYLKMYQDNVINWKPSTTTTASFGVTFDFNFPEMPFFVIGYSPYFQGNDNLPANQIIKNNNHIINFMTGYTYQLSSISASTIFSVNGNWQNTKLGTVSNKFSNVSYLLNQSMNFEFPLSLNSTLSLVKSKILSLSSTITEFDVNGNYQFSELISANLGTTFSNEEHYTKRIMLYMGSSINLAEWLRFELQGNLANYKDLTGGGHNYNDSLFQAIVIVKW